MAECDARNHRPLTADLPGGKNGSVASITNGIDSGRNETMTYDPLNRILSAQTAATSGQDCWGLNFGSSGLADDALGNLLTMTPSKCSGPSLSLSVNGNNQINLTGFSYDSAGNLTNDGTNTYSYNGEDSLIGSSSGSFVYDGDGLLVQAGPSTTDYWRSYAGQTLNISGGVTAEDDIIYFDGLPIAWVDDINSKTYYSFSDMLGSVRAATDSGGNVCFSADYYPYGQAITYTNTCSPLFGFAGYESGGDDNANLYAFARFYSPRLGRFLSADRAGGGVANPQSLNGYSYVVNNPTNLGGAYTVSFTAHMDSAWADNPIGALFHLFIDVFGHKTRNPCP